MNKDQLLDIFALELFKLEEELSKLSQYMREAREEGEQERLEAFKVERTKVITRIAQTYKMGQALGLNTQDLDYKTLLNTIDNKLGLLEGAK